MSHLGIRSLTKQAKQILPAPAVSSVRSVVQYFGQVTAKYRSLPDLIMIGAQRSGTTSLYRLLSAHPEIARPTMSKGIGYFDVNYAKGATWYRAHFPLNVPVRLTGRQRRPLVFESSGYYSFHPLAAERIAADLPQAKLVMMLRDPVERAYSAHRHELVRGFETEPFERALELEDQRLAGETERLLTEPDYQSHGHRHHAYLRRGLYAEQIKRIHAAVGEERLFLMDANDFFQDSVAEFLKLQSWLGLTPWVPTSVPAENAQPRAAMDDKLRQSLREYFAPADHELAQLMGRIPSWRR